MPIHVSTDDITDDYMDDRLGRTRTYTLLVLKPTPRLAREDSRPIVREHGRRNMALQKAGIMPIVCPVGNEQISGIAILDADVERARSIMEGDPGVQAGIFTFEVHPCRGFPGDSLPVASGSSTSG